MHKKIFVLHFLQRFPRLAADLFCLGEKEAPKRLFRDAGPFVPDFCSGNGGFSLNSTAIDDQRLKSGSKRISGKFGVFAATRARTTVQMKETMIMEQYERFNETGTSRESRLKAMLKRLVFRKRVQASSGLISFYRAEIRS